MLTSHPSPPGRRRPGHGYHRGPVNSAALAWFGEPGVGVSGCGVDGFSAGMSASGSRAAKLGEFAFELGDPGRRRELVLADGGRRLRVRPVARSAHRHMQTSISSGHSNRGTMVNSRVSMRLLGGSEPSADVSYDTS
jgi:hypothetical protein